MSFFTDRFASRIGGARFGSSNEGFKFEAIKRAKRAASAAHPETRLIDLGVGEPDCPAFPLAVETLRREAGKPENRLYADNGIPEFKEVAALANPSLTSALAEKYSRRFDLLVPALRAIGFAAKKPEGSFYCYVRAPKSASIGSSGGRVDFATAAEFSDYLIREKVVSTVPWDDAGPYVRFSVTFDAPTPADEVRLVSELSERLRSAELMF